MNLIQQFPDASMHLRAQLKNNQRNYGAANATLPYDIDKALSNYYKGEFRQWHYKLVLIVAGILATLFSAVLYAPGFFNWIVS